ncbi:DUF99 family protein [Haloferacaceae archaeon DSL9]
MKPGTRTLGIAASDGRDESALCGAVVRVDRIVDGFVFGSCAVGGTDATDAAIGMVSRLDRPDARWLILGGLAPAWFNMFDLPRIATATDRPVVSVSFESSPGLENALGEQFSGEDRDRRLEAYRAQPPRRRIDVDGRPLFFRAAGCDADEAATLLRAVTPPGRHRPEPVRVAKLAARAHREALEHRAGADAGDPLADGDETRED